MSKQQPKDESPLSARKRVILSVFIAFNVVATCLWAAPINSPILNKLSSRVGLYLRWSGLGMGWAFFAPDPWNKNVYLTAKIAYRDGHRVLWKFPASEDFGYFRRYFMGRSFMWTYEMLPLNENSGLWPDAARYVARLSNNSDSPPITVTLTRHWAFIPPPGSNEQATWSEADFFTYKVQSADLQ